jgi:tRNA (cytidine/uridine-2'-O-)-methyltransferase
MRPLSYRRSGNLKGSLFYLMVIFPTPSDSPPRAPVGVVLYTPEIPPNTGNIARTCAATGTQLHLIEPLGFKLSDRYLKRAGLDYWDAVDLACHRDWQAFLDKTQPQRIVCFSAHAHLSYRDFCYRPGDWLLFGSETQGLPPEIRENHPKVVIPTYATVRSLNLAVSVGIGLYEALGQLKALQ